jgi:hypothetical protein
MGYPGAGGKLIDEKKPEAKNLVTLSFKAKIKGETLQYTYRRDNRRNESPAACRQVSEKIGSICKKKEDIQWGGGR